MASNRKTKMPCIVLLLDNRQLTIPLSLKAFGQELYEAVHQDLLLVETDYFGLEFKASDDTDRWLDKCKPIGSQTGSKSSLLFHFKVKFYPADPTALKEERTRYLFALQLRQDLASGRLQGCTPRTAALLAAYIVQSELGDYEKVSRVTEGDGASARDDDDETTYIRSIKLIAGQTAELERMIVELHRSLSGQRPSEADFNLLDTARKTDFYGVVLNQVKDADGVPQSLAVTEAGILVFQNNQRVNVFPWAKIRKLCFRRKLFIIKLRPSADRAHPSNLVEFAFTTRNRSKAFWKTCVEHHAFFCCQEAPTSQAKRWPSQVLVRGSTFRYSGRTQVQLIDHVKDNLVKSRPFVRSQSFGTMASGRSCGTASLGSVARSLPLSARSGFAAAAAVVAEGSVDGPSRYDAALASTSAGAQARDPRRDRGPDVTIAAVQPVLRKQHLAEPLNSPQDPRSSFGAASDGTATSPDNAVVQQSNGFSNAADVQDRLANGGSLSSAASSSSSSSAAAAAAAAEPVASTADDFDDDAESLAKLEDAIRSLAAAELKVAADAGVLLTSALESAAGGDGVGSTASVQRRLALSAAEAERAARQQAQDEVLVACRASSLRRSLRRSSTRSTEEEMAQLEDVSDLAMRVMHTDALTAAAAAGGSSKAEPGQPPQQLAGSVGNGKSALIGRAQRLSSLQDLCELASKVMQCDGDLAVSAPFLAGSPSSRTAPMTRAAAAAAGLGGKVELSPSPPPLPVKQHAGTTNVQPEIGRSTVSPLDKEGATLCVDGEGSDALLPPKGGRSIGSSGGGEPSDAPPLPPKCNQPPAHGSLPRNFFRGDRANVATAASWKAASFHTASISGGTTGMFPAAGGLADSKEHVIRLPVRCRAAARAAGTDAASSSSSSSLSSSSSSSTSSSSSATSLPRLTVREAATTGRGSSEGRRLQPSDSAELSPSLRSRGSAAIDDQLDAALNSLVLANGPPAAAAAGHPVAELPTVAPAIEARRVCDSELQQPASAAQPLRLAWHGGDGGSSVGPSYGPLSPEVDDVFVVDSSSGTSTQSVAASISLLSCTAARTSPGLDLQLQ